MRCGLGGIAPLAVAALSEVAEDGAHVEEEQRGEREAVGYRDRRQPGVADPENLALLGGDMGLLDRLATGAVRNLEQGGDILAPALGPVAGGEDRATGLEDRAAAQVG